MKPSNHVHPSLLRKKIPIPPPPVSKGNRSRRPVHVRPLEVTGIDEVRLDGEIPDFIDPHFKSELDYAGFKNVEAFNNREYRNPFDEEDPEKELNFGD